MNLLLSLRTEAAKIRRTAAFNLAFIAGALGPVLTLVDFTLDPPPPNPADKTHLLTTLFTTKFEMTGFMMFPFFIILVCTLLPQLEYRNNTWKQVFSAPQTRLQLFLGKLLLLHGLLLAFLLTNQVSMAFTATVIHFTHPELQLWQQAFDGAAVWRTVGNGYLSLLAVGALQFWLGLRFKNFIAPIGIGVLCWFFGSLLAMEGHPAWLRWFPYSFHVAASFSKYAKELPTVIAASVAFFSLFLTLAFADFRRHR